MFNHIEKEIWIKFSYYFGWTYCNLVQYVKTCVTVVMKIPFWKNFVAKDITKSWWKWAIDANDQILGFIKHFNSSLESYMWFLFCFQCSVGHWNRSTNHCLHWPHWRCDEFIFVSRYEDICVRSMWCFS